MYTSPNAEAGMPQTEPVGSSFSVQRGFWTDLSPEVASMLAPPVTVTAAPAEHVVNSLAAAQLGRSPGTTPVGGRRRHAG
ncbi:hypothetical protein Aca07nite_44680 [Actinoplanes capillaceus]|uniref:Uncharacterized protein n=1 Tax=Actinoplanes campanulatus TaxID=113559 RepID=A0ABQ3WLT0_9ACTN|nr:hypothetical protein Aca07nite_44680 [Actinoplanes capillaceus]